MKFRAELTDIQTHNKKRVYGARQSAKEKNKQTKRGEKGERKEGRRAKSDSDMPPWGVTTNAHTHTHTQLKKKKKPRKQWQGGKAQGKHAIER
jgi:hypothetical protein